MLRWLHSSALWQAVALFLLQNDSRIAMTVSSRNMFDSKVFDLILEANDNVGVLLHTYCVDLDVVPGTDVQCANLSGIQSGGVTIIETDLQLATGDSSEAGGWIEMATWPRGKHAIVGDDVSDRCFATI
jgi:hypothetical protein